jgi:hypothetical protein
MYSHVSFRPLRQSESLLSTERDAATSGNDLGHIVIQNVAHAGIRSFRYLLPFVAGHRHRDMVHIINELSTGVCRAMEF